MGSRQTALAARIAGRKAEVNMGDVVPRYLCTLLTLSSLLYQTGLEIHADSTTICLLQDMCSFSLFTV